MKSKFVLVLRNCIVRAGTVCEINADGIVLRTQHGGTAPMTLFVRPEDYAVLTLVPVETRNASVRQFRVDVAGRQYGFITSIHTGPWSAEDMGGAHRGRGVKHAALMLLMSPFVLSLSESSADIRGVASSAPGYLERRCL